MVKYDVELTDRQSDAWRALHDDLISELLYGGAKGGGKAQALTAQVLTPFGFKAMGDIQVKDVVCCPDGTCSPVIAIHPQGEQQIYKVTCIDGATTRVTGDHLWLASIVGRACKRGGKRGNSQGIYTTSELMAWIDKANASETGTPPNVLIPLCQPVEFTFPSRKADTIRPIDPYILGVLLGDGCLVGSTMTFTSADDGIIEAVKAAYPVHSTVNKYAYSIPDGGLLKKDIQSLNLHGLKSHTKFIPLAYKHAPLDVRWAVVQGLLDTDGHIDDRGHVEYTSTSEVMAKDVQWIIRSLGGKATLTSRIPILDGKECKRAYRLYINIEQPGRLFRLSRKVKNGDGKAYNNGLGVLQRRIIEIVPDGKEDAQCITIRHPAGLYITDDFIVTHNSYFGCAWVYIRCQEIIEEFGLQPSDRPLLIGFMGRKRGVDFTRTTLETWKRFIPGGAYVIKEQAHEIVIAGTVKVGFGGLDSPEVVEKFNSAENAFFFIDQAEETTRDDVAALRASLRLVMPNGGKPRYKALFTANPAICWLRDEFITAQNEHRRFVQALPTDNPHLGSEYINTLEEAFKHRPELLEAYIRGSWDDFAGANQVIKELWVNNAKGVKLYSKEPFRLFVCDPARFGDDETCIYGMKDTEIVKDEIYGQKDTMYTANRLYTFAHRWDDCLVAVDVCGLGAGVVDRLIEMGANVLAINSAEASSDPIRWYNLRAEMWDNAASMFSEGDIELHNQEKVLTGQLITPTYEYRGSKMLIEPKAEIKKRLNRSPDRADCYVMGLHALNFLRRSRWFRGLGDSMSYRTAPKVKAAMAPAGSMAFRMLRRQAEKTKVKQW